MGRVVAQLLTEMDGVSSRGGGGGLRKRKGDREGKEGEEKKEEERGKVFLLGCTAHLKAVDEAFLRPGRFGTIIHIKKPTLEERIEILMCHTR